MEDMSLSIEECIRTYERELLRKDFLESKASALLTTSSLVVSILIGLITLIFTGMTEPNGILICINILALYFVFKSIYYSLDVLKINFQKIPFEVNNPNSLKKDLCKDKETLKQELFKRYLNLIPPLHVLNNDKRDKIIKSLNFLIIGLVSSVIALIIFIVIR